METLNKEKSFLIKASLVLVVVLSLYFLVKTIAEIKNYYFIGGGATASNVISFEGQGEVSATSDLATVNFTIRENQKELKNAQDKVTAKEQSILTFLKVQDIADKDIKTESYNSYPKYDYGVPCYGGMGIPCRQDAPTIIGYEVSEYISVKIRDLAKVGAIVKGIGAVGVSEMNGPNFSIEDEEGLKEQARQLAINDAKDKAKTLSKDLGVKLVRIVDFYENGNYPVMYSTYSMEMKNSAVGAPTPDPELPAGENKITSNVTITYEIR